MSSCIVEIQIYLCSFGTPSDLLTVVGPNKEFEMCCVFFPSYFGLNWSLVVRRSLTTRRLGDIQCKPVLVVSTGLKYSVTYFVSWLFRVVAYLDPLPSFCTARVDEQYHAFFLFIHKSCFFVLLFHLMCELHSLIKFSFICYS